MKAPKGLTVKFDRVKDGKAYFNIRATKFYLFKMILKIAGQHMHRPAIAALITGYAFYYLVKN